MLIAYLVELLEDLLENMLIMFVLIAAVILIITAIIVRFALERRAKAESIPIPEQPPVPQQIQSSRNIGGTVTQIREIRSAVYGQTKNRYFELAVTYDAGNGMQTALIGVRTDERGRQGALTGFRAADAVRHSGGLHRIGERLRQPAEAESAFPRDRRYPDGRNRDRHFCRRCKGA